MPKMYIEIPIFLTPKGKPTCCKVWGKENCQFLRTSNFGTREECCVTNTELKREPRADGLFGDGYLIPDKECFLWGGSSFELRDIDTP